ncbi:glycoside hydrolase family 3 N-terminal domain-containing protein [Leifsonia xyli]|uniref:glycoside hydrolase family 3 N-terminal domain-containing protein n=1 Tax=Leifsonia xyli TaxID=1575 RepID=UPI003D663D1B
MISRTRSCETLLSSLTLEEKARLLEGHDFWGTYPVDRLGIRRLFLTDGPHGVRKVRAAEGAFGVSDNVPSTAFPPAVTVASTWDPSYASRLGAAIGHEAVDMNVDVMLGPGVNIKRNPLCGRNFEYFSEDPLVSGVFGAAFVQGVQSQGVAASVKHFAANSNEDYRFVGDSLVDERALREIYLRQFERIVREAKPATVMCAYNAVNGTFSSDNAELLTGILRDEWGFDGAVMTDWGATHDRVASLRAGCELDMPGGASQNRSAIIAAVRDGQLPEAVLDEAVRRVLALIDRCDSATKPSRPHDPAEHAALARDIATDGAVLLTNDGTLPLDPGKRLVVVGELFDRMRFQGAGSSLINPTDVVTPKDAFDARGIRYGYARGYRAMADTPDPELEAKALAEARRGSTVLFFGGLNDLEESEGFDRQTMAMSRNQTQLLTKLLDAGARVVLVLFAGAPVELPFADRLAGILDMHLPGMHGGEATARLLFGEASPSGKLAESWPITAADASSAADYDQSPVARYYESVYVGYRFYDSAAIRLRFPFGHGLSYTTFGYRELAVAVTDGTVRVNGIVDNLGVRDGAEVVQVYVGNNRGKVFKADKELRGFTRVPVAAGGSAPFQVEFPISELSYWDVGDHDWVLENGQYEVLVGASAADIRLRVPLTVDAGRTSRSPYPAAVDADYATPPTSVPETFPALLGRPVMDPPRSRRLTMETRLIDARRSIMGGIMLRVVSARVRADYRAALAMPDGHERDARVKNAHFVLRMMPFQSLRSMVMSSSGALPAHVAEGIADIASWRPIRGLRKILGKAHA